MIAWSFQALAAGMWPDKNAQGIPYADNSTGKRLAGTALAGPWRGLLCAVTGDLEFHGSGYQLQNPNSGDAKPECRIVGEALL